MKNKISSFVNIILIIMTISTAVMCMLWMPQTIDYCKDFLVGSKLLSLSNVELILYIFAFVIALPIFVIFFISFKFSSYIKNDTIFHTQTAKRLTLISLLLISDCVLFLTGALALLTTGEKILSPLFIFVSVIGITVAAMLRILSDYVSRAAILKEEADFTL
jgi:hypothetical protein